MGEVQDRIDFTVVIPLYNKEKEIARTLHSVLAQTYAPLEILVVDDGSTDGSARVVRSFASPLIRLLPQANAGVAAARNRAAGEASGNYIAFLDGDDAWKPDYLASMARLIRNWPGCGMYAAAFDAVSGGKVAACRTYDREGVVTDFFCISMHRIVCQTSFAVVPRDIFLGEGGFPKGMKLGEDLYLWIKIAWDYPVCFTPERLGLYNRSASNRSAAIYTAEETVFSLEDLYMPGRDDLNEFLAKCAIGKAITLSSKGDTLHGRRTEKFFSYTKCYRRGLWKLRLLNRLPVRWRSGLLACYERLAWTLARKGL